MTGPVPYLGERRLVTPADRILAMEGLAETTRQRPRCAGPRPGVSAMRTVPAAGPPAP
jgi:hypothetical protein